MHVKWKVKFPCLVQKEIYLSGIGQIHYGNLWVLLYFICLFFYFLFVLFVFVFKMASSKGRNFVLGALRRQSPLWVRILKFITKWLVFASFCSDERKSEGGGTFKGAIIFFETGVPNILGHHKIVGHQNVGSHKMTTDSVFILFKKTDFNTILSCF